MNKRTQAALLAVLICITGCDQDETITIPMDRNGTYRAGEWTYDFLITNPGTKSQGSLGRLSYQGKPVPKPANSNDYFDTTLGQFVFVGMVPGTPDHPLRPWDHQGWVRIDPNQPKPTGNVWTNPDQMIRFQEKNVLAREQIIQILEQALAKDNLKDAFEEKDDTGESENPDDPWGTPYRTFSDLRGGEGSGQVIRLYVSSAGPDKIFDTEDDIREHSPFVQVSSSNDTNIQDEWESMTESGVDMKPEEQE